MDNALITTVVTATITVALGYAIRLLFSSHRNNQPTMFPRTNQHLHNDNDDSDRSAVAKATDRKIIEPVLTHKVAPSHYIDTSHYIDSDIGNPTPASTSTPSPRGITIVTISDTHGHHRKLTMPPGDILIHAGDYTLYGKREHADDFNVWLGELLESPEYGYKHVFVVNGNHEVNASWKRSAREILSHATLLVDQCVTIDLDADDNFATKVADSNELGHGSGLGKKGNHRLLKIHGMNFSWPLLYGSDPRFDQICQQNPPDILISHGPAQGYVDGNQGCPALAQLVQRVQPQLVISGHIHSARGVAVSKAGDGDRGIITTFVNSATASGGMKGGHSFGKQPIVLLL